MFHLNAMKIPSRRELRHRDDYPKIFIIKQNLHRDFIKHSGLGHEPEGSTVAQFEKIASTLPRVHALNHFVLEMPSHFLATKP
jgi:hypothetical protein